MFGRSRIAVAVLLLSPLFFGVSAGVSPGVARAALTSGDTWSGTLTFSASWNQDCSLSNPGEINTCTEQGSESGSASVSGVLSGTPQTGFVLDLTGPEQAAFHDSTVNDSTFTPPVECTEFHDNISATSDASGPTTDHTVLNFMPAGPGFTYQVPSIEDLGQAGPLPFVSGTNTFSEHIDFYPPDAITPCTQPPPIDTHTVTSQGFAVGTLPPAQTESFTDNPTGPTTVSGSFSWTDTNGRHYSESWTLDGPPCGVPSASSAMGRELAALGGDTVIFDAVRNRDTPPGMPDRIPPRVSTPIKITVDLETCKDATVIITSKGHTGDGTVLIEGAKRVLLTRRGHYDLNYKIKGVDMTDIGRGPHLNLIAIEVDNKTGKRTQIGETFRPFAVTAIPVNFFDRLIDRIPNPHLRGIQVQDSWQSDSTKPEDLNGVVMSELVDEVQGHPLIKQSEFLPADHFTVDEHRIGLKYIPETPGIFTIVDQVSCFADLRAFPPTSHTHPNPADIFSMKNSGYLIRQAVVDDPIHDDLAVTTEKFGRDETVTSILPGYHAPITCSSDPGFTSPIPGIALTQDRATGDVEPLIPIP
jgi:hypothetical protein